MIGRRRALTLIASFAAAPALARPARETLRWRGLALGAEAEITLSGPRDLLARALAAAEEEIAAAEALFSLYRPESFLSRLNTTGSARVEDPRIGPLLDAVDRVHAGTGGLFDPSVQALWQAKWRGDPLPSPVAGWSAVRRKDDRLYLGPGQALTFNGIAQGYATDRVTARLRDLGATETLVNIGEFRALGGPFRLGIEDPGNGLIGQRTLTDSAIATSSPGALRFADGTAHILAPPGLARSPRWASVSVEAETATLADALSTALCLTTMSEAKAIAAEFPDVRRVSLIDEAGNLSTLW